MDRSHPTTAFSKESGFVTKKWEEQESKYVGEHLQDLGVLTTSLPLKIVQEYFGVLADETVNLLQGLSKESIN